MPQEACCPLYPMRHSVYVLAAVSDLCMLPALLFHKFTMKLKLQSVRLPQQPASPPSSSLLYSSLHPPSPPPSPLLARTGEVDDAPAFCSLVRFVCNGAEDEPPLLQTPEEEEERGPVSVFEHRLGTGSGKTGLCTMGCLPKRLMSKELFCNQRCLPRCGCMQIGYAHFDTTSCLNGRLDGLTDGRVD